jgi:holo-[acyl-carrier protein] synthase
MSILGIGIDIVEVNRIKKILKENRSFIDRIYTKHERSSCIGNKKVFCYAKKYAAKEAFVKALGTGFRCGINFKNIEIKNDKLGKPFIKIDKVLSHKIKKKHKIKNFNIFLSLSDENKYAIASVVISK